MLCLVLLGPIGFLLPPLAQPTAPTNHGTEGVIQMNSHQFLGLGPEAWTAVFTLFLTVSTLMLWLQTRSAARESVKSLKIVERAYLFWDLRKSFVIDQQNGVLTVKFYAHNSGKTPAVAREVYGEISQAFPPVPRTYTKTERRLKIDISIQADAIGELGKTTNPAFPEQGMVAFGYVKYHDIFGDEHKTGFAVVYNAAIDPPQWEASGPGCGPWNYSD